jgi:hypothetical protein
MNPYYACSSCARYVKHGDSVCPFCGTAKRATTGPTARRPGRTSRAQWLAYGSSLAVVGCTGGAATPSSAADATAQSEIGAPQAEAAEAAGASDTASADANAGVDSRAEAEANDAGGSETTTADVTPTDAASPQAISFASADGSFGCLGGAYNDATTCDRATQWCEGLNGGSAHQCVSLDHLCGNFGLADSGCTPPIFYWDAAACDGGYRRCACVTVSCTLGASGPGLCTDDDAGGVTVTCGSCYGAPPARLERLEAPLGVHP